MLGEKGAFLGIEFSPKFDTRACMQMSSAELGCHRRARLRLAASAHRQTKLAHLPWGGLREDWRNVTPHRLAWATLGGASKFLTHILLTRDAWRRLCARRDRSVAAAAAPVLALAAVSAMSPPIRSGWWPAAASNEN